VTSSEEVAVCNLGSLNLGKFVTEKGEFDFEKLKVVVDKAVTFLDRVVDINFYPIPEAKNSNHKWRPVGLGIMGLQDALFKMRLPYESDAALEMSSKISETVYYQSLLHQSEQLAREVVLVRSKSPLYFL
jgi:ribonucleoside-diphosphate reductase alpha chain